MGWIAACVLVALLLPLAAMLYLDILEAKHEVKEQVEKVERLRREIERSKRDQDRKEPDSFGDNPVFDRVRRPFSLPLPKPHKLE
jgi:type II secretory pathway component PulJ